MTRASLRGTLPIVAPVAMTLLPGRAWTQEQWERIQRGYRLYLPQDRPAPPPGLIEHSILGLRSNP